MTNSAHSLDAGIADTVAGSAHLAELLRALPELARQHVTATAKFEACAQMIALYHRAQGIPVTSLVDAEDSFAESNSVSPAGGSAQSNVQQRLADDIDAKWAALYARSHAAWPPALPPHSKRLAPQPKIARTLASWEMNPEDRARVAHAEQRMHLAVTRARRDERMRIERAYRKSERARRAALSRVRTSSES